VAAKLWLDIAVNDGQFPVLLCGAAPFATRLQRHQCPLRASAQQACNSCCAAGTQVMGSSCVQSSGLHPLLACKDAGIEA
jgi:hypothetical protein